jgi:hypothetical protein
MGEECGMNGGEKGCIQGSSGEGDYLEDLGVDVRIVYPRKRMRCVGWIDLAQDRNKWQALVNMVMFRGLTG